MGGLLSRRRDKKTAKAAEEEQKKKVDLLCQMFPMLDKDMIVTVLDANEGDVERTMEMFMPVSPDKMEEHQKRPPSRAGEHPERPSSSSSKDIEELILWAASTDLDVQFQAARSFADLAITEEQRVRIVRAGGLQSLVCLLQSQKTEVQRCA
eukprot:1926969-Rhodomonas_salina.1